MRHINKLKQNEVFNLFYSNKDERYGAHSIISALNVTFQEFYVNLKKIILHWMSQLLYTVQLLGDIKFRLKKIRFHAYNHTIKL